MKIYLKSQQIFSLSDLFLRDLILGFLSIVLFSPSEALAIISSFNPPLANASTAIGVSTPNPCSYNKLLAFIKLAVAV